jgi:hypothetical protein
VSTRSLNLAWQITAPKGHNRIAQGFNPGCRVLQRCALKGHQSWYTSSSSRIPYPARTRSGATFRVLPIVPRYPGLKPWAVLLRPFGADDDEDSLSDEAYFFLQQPRLVVGRSRKYDGLGNTPPP